MLLRVIFDNTPIVPQTSKNPENVVATSLTSNYLCLQCSTIIPEEDRAKHGQKKSHRFYVDSRSGALFCQFCEDFVWDPTLEELRVRKIGTGSFSSRSFSAPSDLDVSKSFAGLSGDFFSSVWRVILGTAVFLKTIANKLRSQTETRGPLLGFCQGRS